MSKNDWQVVLVVGIGITALWAAVLGLWLAERFRKRRLAASREARKAERARVRAEDEQRRSPHPGYSCGPLCDITDEAHGFGGVWFAEGDVPADPVPQPDPDEADGATELRPVTAEDSVRTNNGLWSAERIARTEEKLLADDEDDEDDEDDSTYHQRHDDEPTYDTPPDYREEWPTVPPLRGNPIPMNREPAVVAVRVLDEPWEPSEAGMRALVTETGSYDMFTELLHRDGRTEAEVEEALAFYRDPLGSWCAPPKEAVQEAEEFFTLADEWLMREEFLKWQEAPALSR